MVGADTIISDILVFIDDSEVPHHDLVIFVMKHEGALMVPKTNLAVNKKKGKYTGYPTVCPRKRWQIRQV